MKYLLLFVFLMPVSSHAMGDWFGGGDELPTEFEATEKASSMSRSDCVKYLKDFYKKFYGDTYEDNVYLISQYTKETCNN